MRSVVGWLVFCCFFWGGRDWRDNTICFLNDCHLNKVTGDVQCGTDENCAKHGMILSPRPQTFSSKTIICASWWSVVGHWGIASNYIRCRKWLSLMFIYRWIHRPKLTHSGTFWHDWLTDISWQMFSFSSVVQCFLMESCPFSMPHREKSG
jgi:hypothetical protein